MIALRTDVPGEVWAPHVERPAIVIDGTRRPLERLDGGWWGPPRPLRPGDRYLFDLGQGRRRPDPRSRWQPDGVAGPTEVVDATSFPWTDAAWTPPPWPEAVIYELHVGSFSDAGTFRGAIEHLDHLVELGVTHVELMPVAAAAGRFGWGYDGVLLWATHQPYGHPDDLRALVDACHQRGLAVLVDVVLNHLGPAENHLAEFGPYFTDRYRTPWGDALNVDGPDSDEVRAHLLGAALHWVTEAHVDGFRLDAAHAIIDTSAVHLVEELTARTDRLGASLGRELVVVAEWDRADPTVVTERDRGGLGCRAQWADDLHHALHATLTGERGGYYRDFDGGSGQVADVLRHVYAFRDTWSEHHRRHVGRDPGALPRDRFVVALQNHDQVGNRAGGERLHHLVPLPGVLAAAALVLLAPQVPLVFQGEEWAASTTFPYVADHGGELGDAIRAGRLAEFAAFGWAPDEVADPIDPRTAASARLRWDERHDPPHDRVLAWYRRLIEIRRTLVTPDAPVEVTHDDGLVTLVRPGLVVAVNLHPDRAHLLLGAPPHADGAPDAPYGPGGPDGPDGVDGVAARGDLVAASVGDVEITGEAVRVGPRSAAVLRSGARRPTVSTGPTTGSEAAASPRRTP